MDRGLPSAQVVLIWTQAPMLKELKGSALFQLFKSERLPHVYFSLNGFSQTVSLLHPGWLAEGI